ncbi:MAG: hypothetical protein MI702_07600, partial [Chlorobiales bacterium]|nr:hypothetical protein [Chlorobiales bacterium]
LPGSKMFNEYRTRIINWNWADWNCNTLVWKHPHITPKEMENILVYAKRKTSLSKILFDMIKRGALDDAFDGDSILSTVLKQAFRLSSLLRQPSVR